ncbi:MAG TPA: alpha/beta hydrolase [Microbacterium sp.]|uniref:alpha/beta fold hydrolase n=1 Tax=Microbacterium sp. TaxID=51671 RepID=UPI002CE09C72|nr:alpha/beta hydrolase [Microbacterium sp.]HWI30059.1 alpha/beta hydrolase [Microbacterium sp.]
MFVHGWAGSAESWTPILSLLPPGARAHSARLPHSPRSASASPPSIVAAAVEVASWLRSTGVPAVLVGHSLGAQVTMRVHGMVPELVRGEIVVDPAYGGSAAERSAMKSWAHDIEERGHESVDEFFRSALGGLNGADRERVVRDLADTPGWVIAAYLRSEYLDAEAFGLLPRSAEVAGLRTKPVLALHSTSEGVERERRIPAPPGSRIDLWSGRGHYLHLEDPERFAALVAEWCAHVADLTSD